MICSILGGVCLVIMFIVILSDRHLVTSWSGSSRKRLLKVFTDGFAFSFRHLRLCNHFSMCSWRLVLIHSWRCKVGVDDHDNNIQQWACKVWYGSFMVSYTCHRCLHQFSCIYILPQLPILDHQPVSGHTQVIIWSNTQCSCHCHFPSMSAC